MRVCVMGGVSCSYVLSLGRKSEEIVRLFNIIFEAHIFEAHIFEAHIFEAHLADAIHFSSLHLV